MEQPVNEHQLVSHTYIKSSKKNCCWSVKMSKKMSGHKIHQWYELYRWTSANSLLLTMIKLSCLNCQPICLSEYSYLRLTIIITNCLRTMANFFFSPYQSTHTAIPIENSLLGTSLNTSKFHLRLVIVERLNSTVLATPGRGGGVSI